MKFDKDKFKAWLIKNKNLGSKSANDICSRLNRVNKLVTKNTSSLNSMLETLNSSKDFNGLSMSIKSQLRRSLKLYFEFKQKG